MEEWQAVKAILEDPARYKYERGGLPRYLLSGLVHCGHCDAKMYSRKIRGNRVYYCSLTAPPGGKIKLRAGVLGHVATIGRS
jgi:hypothetical protein